MRQSDQIATHAVLIASELDSIAESYARIAEWARKLAEEAEAAANALDISRRRP